jgi:hypothetical protein
MRKWVVLLGLLGIAACDNAVVVGNPLMAGPRYGDFVMLAEGYEIPDAVRMGDTISIPFRVGDGAHPCLLVGPMWVWQSRVFYLVAWGTRPRRESCVTPTFKVWGPNLGEEPKIDSVRGGRTFYGDNPDIVYRVIVCRPDGSYDRKDIVVVPPWPTRGRLAQNEDIVRKIDARECRGLTRIPGA